jgi:sigma-B regulation protein RsbU (phosphoserine phosphatase)
VPTGSPFSPGELLRCSTSLCTIGEHAESLEEVAREVVTQLRDSFIDKETGQPAFALARFYLTRRLSELPPDLQDFARAAGTDVFAFHDPICLALLATAGEEAAWNDRRNSIAHKAIPLPSVEAIQRAPMVARLVEQLGLDPHRVVGSEPSTARERDERDAIFFVPEARDSEYVPAQNNFVIPYGIRSVLGYGDLLPDGSMYAVLLFSTTSIPPGLVGSFSTLSLSSKVAVLPHLQQATFAERTMEPPHSSDSEVLTRLMLSDARAVAFTQLFSARANLLESELVRVARNEADSEQRRSDQEVLVSEEARNISFTEESPTSVIGMDHEGRITHFNRAAEHTFGFDRASVVGELLGDVLVPPNMRERHRAGLRRLRESGEGAILGRTIEVSALRSDGTEIPIELVVVQVPDTSPPVFNGYLRDLTADRHLARELMSGREQLAHIARSLQNSLLPPSLPEINGYELAAAFRAMGAGYEVGGDFYDVFQLNHGRWALTLGDVVGKGSDAAVITALARYTLRAAAMHDPSPTAVLGTLNEAIHRQHPREFCTAVFASLDPDSGALEIALGGHPHPLLVSAKGLVREVGNSSALLGPIEHWEGTSAPVVLERGDSLILFSDGLTEARRGAEFFGDERLVDLLSAEASLPLPNLVGLIESTVSDFAGTLADDLAVLALRRL